VITENSTVVDLLATAAGAAVGTLASGEPLRAGEPMLGSETELDFDAENGAGGSAVLVQFTGAVSGDLVLVVDGELGAALQDTPLGPLDLTAALAPVLEAVTGAIGPVVTGAPQELDVRLAVRRALAHGDAGLVPLLGGSGLRAAIAVGLESTAAVETPVQHTKAAAAAAAIAEQHAAASSIGGFVPSADRLELLRGVEMQATAELGRVRMTVNDLLTLRDGAVIELDRAAGAPADLYVNGRLIARGEVVVVDENYGLRITQVVTDADNR